MPDDERSRLHRLVQQSRPSPSDLGSWLDALCRVGAAELGSDAVAISAGPDDRGDFAVMAGSSLRARRCAETEFAAGTGPSRDASSRRRPVLARDLRGQASIMWPGLAGIAEEEGVNAVYAFPLQLGALRIGVLTAYAAASEPLPSGDLATGLLLAEMATLRLIDRGAADEAGGHDGQPLTGRIASSIGRRSEVYQAQGMIAVAAGVDLGAALSLLRAHAFASGADLDDVSAAVVRGELDLSSTARDPRDRGGDDLKPRDHP